MADYYDRVNPDLLANIPASAQRILEFGCGAGALGLAVKAARPGVEYFGVELCAEPAQRARGRLNGVVEANADTFDPLTEFKPSSFDLIIYGDVLEHLRDPGEVLAKHRILLADGGRVLACIPNIQHWTMLMHLIQGTWQYSAEGLLDKTHIRFFDLRSIALMFQQAGFRIENALSRVITVNQAAYERVQALLAPLLTEAGVNPQEYRNRSAAYQYVVLAQKTP
jgi:2-polyprenyl-3-methyl-5-hydroxy-6-metoxy-1,4-benzoquinol methylase